MKLHQARHSLIKKLLSTSKSIGELLNL
jgi:hypothetical protein